MTLRDVVDEDLRTFFEYQSDPLSINMAQVAPRDEAAFLTHWKLLLGDESVGKRTILCDQAAAGYAMSFTRHGVRELGYWLGREFWGRGIAGAAVQQYLELERRRPLFAVVAEHNIASRRILSRCGFEELSRQGDVLRLQLAGEPGRDTGGS